MQVHPAFDEVLGSEGIRVIRLPYRSPRANAIAERVVRSLRSECLDHISPLSEGHVRSVLAEFVSYYNQDRPHRSLALETPVPSRRQVDGEVVSLGLFSAACTMSTNEPPDSD